MSARQLTVLMSGQTAGHVTRSAGGGGPLVFEYDESYAGGPAAVPLSLSMPLRQRRFADARVQGWMAGLLPGHPRVRSHWAAKHGAASAEPFDLLATKAGLECAGAVQFCDPATMADTAQPGGVDWLTPAQTEEMVAEMVSQTTLWGRQLRRSAFSLAGAFAKTALYRDDSKARRWGEPHGSHPSTHILKTPMPGEPEQSINEHLCLTTARYSGVDAAETELQTWAGHTVVVVGRFDRIRDAGGVLRRVHQEDLHQAAGDYEASIYQGDDGDGHDPARPRPAAAGPLDRTRPRRRRLLRRAGLQLVDLQHRRSRQELQRPSGTQRSTARSALRHLVGHAHRPALLRGAHHGDVRSR